MPRDLTALAGVNHDLLVIGGGIQGATVAWDAALRGLRVALIERDQFGAATSANSLRIVHGGLRYLSRGDLPRMRESIRERSTLLRIAPGLVEPLGVAIPTGVPGYPGRTAMALALRLNDLVSAGRNRHLLPSSHIPPGRLVSPGELAELCPPLRQIGSRGGALWHDARMSHPERLIYAFVRSATERGAVAVNYACAEQFTLSGGRVLAVAIRDGLSGERHKVRARQIVVAAGPWTDSLVDQMAGSGRAPDGPERHALALNLVLGRRLAQVAMGVRSRLSRDDDPVGGGARFLFLAPQQGSTLLGTWYGIADEASTPAALDRGTRMLLQDANAACPELGLTPADIVDRQWGRLPLDPGPTAGLADRPRIRGEGGRGLDNVLAVEPVKFTTARAVAERVVDRVVRVAGHDRVACRTHLVPLSGAGPAPAGSGERGSA